MFLLDPEKQRLNNYDEQDKLISDQNTDLTNVEKHISTSVRARSSLCDRAEEVVCCPMLHLFPVLPAEGPGSEWISQCG